MKNKTVGRLINDEQLKHLLNDSEYYGTHAWDEFCNMISECDAVDAVQVVRCRECEYYVETNGRIGTCELTISGAKDDGFCAWGVRKNNADN